MLSLPRFLSPTHVIILNTGCSLFPVSRANQWAKEGEEEENIAVALGEPKTSLQRVKNAGKEALQWGVAAGIYFGLTYGLKEARGAHDWKNSAVAGAITGETLALTLKDSTHEHGPPLLV